MAIYYIPPTIVCKVKCTAQQWIQKKERKQRKMREEIKKNATEKKEEEKVKNCSIQNGVD